MGGGQLGRMFVHAAQRHGLPRRRARPRPGKPRRRWSPTSICKRPTSTSGGARRSWHAALRGHHDRIRERAGRGAAHAGARAGRWRRRRDAVAICQDRAREKAHSSHCRRALCAARADRDRASDLARRADALLPGILKTASLGYDGKGQVARRRRAPRWPRPGRRSGGVPCVLESGCRCARDQRHRRARRATAQCVHLPVQQNLHRDGILAVTQVPAPDVPRQTLQQAVALARAAGRRRCTTSACCASSSSCCEDGALVANEMAPRPHNSGHYSIDACDVSQFDLQVRTLAGLPLVAPRQHSPAVMLNLLGDLWFDAQPATATARARLGRGAGAARRASAPVRQGRAAAGPQDGPSDGHRRRARRPRAPRHCRPRALLGLPAF